MTISTLTTEDIQLIYESAVHDEATKSDESGFVLDCVLDDAGGTGAVIRKLIDMVRARDVELLAVREAQPVAVIRHVVIGEGKTGCHATLFNPLPAGTELYTAPPAPAVTVNFKALAEDLVDNLVDCGGADEEVVEQYLAYAEKTCRAALAAAPTTTKPE